MAMIIAINLSLRCQAWLARKSPTSMGKSHMKKWASKPCLITYSNMASIEPQRHIFETFWWFLKSCSSNKIGFQIGSKCPIVQNPPILKCVLFQFQPSRSFFAGFFEVAKAIIDRTNLVWARHELGFHHQKWSFCWDFYPNNIMENWDFTEFVGGYNRISIESWGIDIIPQPPPIESMVNVGRKSHMTGTVQWGCNS